MTPHAEIGDDIDCVCSGRWLFYSSFVILSIGSFSDAVGKAAKLGDFYDGKQFSFNVSEDRRLIISPLGLERFVGYIVSFIFMVNFILLEYFLCILKHLPPN